MGKTVLKTTLLTILTLVLLFIISFSLACFIAPGKLSNFVKQIGIDSFSTHLSIYQYNRSKDINDLGIAVERAIDSKSHNQVREYAKKLIENERYAEFVAFKNSAFSESNTSGIAFYYDNYIEANYVYSCYKTDGASPALFKEAQNFVDKTPNEYLLNNAVSLYVKAYVEAESRPSSDEITAYLDKKYADLLALDELSFHADMKRVCFDLYSVYDAAGDAEQKNYWKTEYEKY